MKSKRTVVFRSKHPQRVNMNNINDIMNNQIQEMEERFVGGGLSGLIFLK